MNLLLTFLIGLFVLAVASADREIARPRPIVLFAVCAVVAVGYTARRFI